MIHPSSSMDSCNTNYSIQPPSPHNLPFFFPWSHSWLLSLFPLTTTVSLYSRYIYISIETPIGNWGQSGPTRVPNQFPTMMGCEMEEFVEWNFDKFDFGFEFLHTDHHPYMSLEMESPATSSDRSGTGYLQDALLDWSNDGRCNNKRRRIEEEKKEKEEEEFCWDWNFETVMTTPSPSVHKEETPKKQQKQPHPSSSESNGTAKRTRTEEKEMVVGVTVYPFTVVKPGGIDGDVTLDDINKRILRRPTRPIRHPVGEFKCLPSFSVLNGRGLSGKPVVGLTTIHTQGTGTLTIIRTKD